MNILFFLAIVSIFKSKENNYIELKIDCQTGNICFIPVYFGSNHEPFKIQLDTTTSYTWIPSTNFDLDVPKYNILESNYGKRTNKTIEIEDEDGVIYGKLSFDSINIDNININRFNFILANGHDPFFKDYPKGKLGLGYDSDDKYNLNFIHQLKEQKLIEKELFIIDKFSKKLIIGKIPDYLEDVPKTTCSLYNSNDLDEKNKQSWGCELYKIFCGIYESNLVTISFNEEGQLILTEENSIDYDISKDAYEPAIFDITYPYIKFPKKYLNYIKGNLIIKYLEGLCEENKDRDSIFFICDKKNIFEGKSYLSLFINKRMFFFYSSDLFKPLEDEKFELLIRFPRNREDNAFKIGAPFLNKWIIAYDYEEKEIIFYGENFIDLSCRYFKFKFWKIFWKIIYISFILLISFLAIVGMYLCCNSIFERRK